MNDSIVDNKKFLFVTVFILCSILTKAQVSFISNGQQINHLAGRGVILADFNGDTTLDAFIVNEDGQEGNGNRIYFGDGHGQFTESSQILTDLSGWAGIPAIGDINGDERAEVITGNTVWLNDGTGNFTANTTCFPVLGDTLLADISLANLNEDNFPDLFVTIYHDLMSEGRVYLNDGLGHFSDTKQHIGRGYENSITVALGDVNNDEHIDAVITGWRDTLSQPCPNNVWINDGDGNFHAIDTLEEGMDDSHGLALGDIDNDDDLDIVLGMQGQYSTPFGRTYFNDGQGHFTAGQTIGSKIVEKAVLGDLDNDGDLDIFLSCWATDEIWINDGNGQFNNSGLNIGTSVCGWSAALGDLNGDDKLDIFVVNIAFDNPYAPRGRYAEIWLNTSGQTSINQNSINRFEIFPNPSSGLYTLSFGTNPIYEVFVEIYDFQGNRVYSEKFYNIATANIDLTDFSAGMYMIKVVAGGVCYEEKVLKE